ncbi:four-helix bundle copper-binding protein [Azonexus sp. IMCC34842]|uniref:four-helix bundle copper-binding protein n=1 Tax=Azonexus sp. IMCC34842 TaxID=3420950 RepID=UPI003D1406A4
MLNEIQSECLQACNDCATACLECASACLNENDPKMMARCISLDMECADFCRLAAASIARGDEHMKEVCALCAVICHACSGECASHEMDHCQHCAKAGARCVEACNRLIQSREGQK